MPTIDLGSVVGPQGEQGNTGPQGEQGVAGPSLISASTQTTLTGVLAGDGGTVGVRAVDSTPTANSTNLVSSGGVYTKIAADVANAISSEILHFSGQAVSAATNAQICRIPASGTNSAITANHVLLDAVFANPTCIVPNFKWDTYDGYMTLTGTATAATTVDVVLGKKGN